MPCRAACDYSPLGRNRCFCSGLFGTHLEDFVLGLVSLNPHMLKGGFSHPQAILSAAILSTLGVQENALVNFPRYGRHL